MPKPRALYKASPEDFRVEEVPLYAPSGSGEHLYVTFEKRGLTTDEAVRLLSRAAGVQPRDVGVAGVKDKHAVTVQTVSLPIPPAAKGGDPSARLEAAGVAGNLAGIRLLSMTRHGNKLKTGHLAGNRFDLVLREVRALDVPEIEQRFAALAKEGVPNAYGVQRFGTLGDNALRAREWLGGTAPGPRDPRQRRFMWSALQSALFNEVLEARVADGTWLTPLAGDLCKIHASGGVFLCEDPAVDGARARAGELCATGPMVGVKMTAPAGAPAELERALTEKVLGPGFDLAATRALGEGTRRGLVLLVEGMTVELAESHPPDDIRLQKDGARREEDRALRVRFVLPRGAYATTVLSAALDIAPPARAASQDRTDEAAPS
jgi:tRNA pseudouridine13 synthase